MGPAPRGPGGQCPLADGQWGEDEGHARHEADEGLCLSPQSRHFERADRRQARAFGQRTFRHGPQPWTVTVDARRSCQELIPPQERALSPKSLLTDQALLSQGILRGQPPPGPPVPAPAPLWALGLPGRWACRSPASWPSPSPQLSPASRVFTAHTGVCVSPAHSGCRPRRTPAAAPCGWKRRTRPEGQAWSRPGPSGAVVRVSLWIGPGLAGQDQVGNWILLSSAFFYLPALFARGHESCKGTFEYCTVETQWWVFTLWLLQPRNGLGCI